MASSTDTQVNLVINTTTEEIMENNPETLVPNQLYLTPENSELPPNPLSKTSIPNVILAAPNGIFTNTSTTFTLKAGVTLTIPDGLNADGTPKNIVHTLSEDVLYTLPSGDTYQRHFWYRRTSNQVFIAVWNLGPCMSPPTVRSGSYERYFNVPENRWYGHNTTTDTWSIETDICYLTQFTTNNGSIVYVNPMSTLTIPQDDIAYESFISTTAFFRLWRSGFKEIWFEANLTGSWKNITIPFPKGFRFRNTQFTTMATSNSSRNYIGANAESAYQISAAYASGTDYSSTTVQSTRFYCAGF